MKTAIIIITIDARNIHADLKILFRKSKATTNIIRIAATVLTCNPTTTYSYLLPLIY